MATKMFVNLPVKSLARSVDFFGRLGYRFDPRFTDEKATCMIVGDDSNVMLLTGSFFETFTPKPLADARRVTEAIVALSLSSRAEVDRMVDTAVALGAHEARPTEDHGFMYGRSFEDLDGHIWEHFWMDPAQLGTGAMAGQQASTDADTPREMLLTRIVDAPRDAVYAAFTQPDSLRRWFGPAGFTLPGCELDLRVGGAYRFVMRGPDDEDYPMHGTYQEISPEEKLVFTAVIEGEHGSEQLTTIHFAAVGRRTRVTIGQTVPTHEPYARGQEQGWSESLERLEALLSRS
jgi:predicted lactoylglutathione lyase/uncharacterized protein YndB with AHSA1/START domain